jgi:hypothetical protein
MQNKIPCQPERSELSFWDEAAITASTAVAKSLFGRYDELLALLNSNPDTMLHEEFYKIPAAIGASIADGLLAARRTRESMAPQDEIVVED